MIVFGKIYLMDTETLQLADWQWGGDQPTGLDVAPYGEALAFTNFLDNTVERYQLED